MYGKYKDISVGVQDLHTCCLCFERPMFLCKDDLTRHSQQYHMSNQNNEAERKHQVELLKQAILNPDHVIAKQTKLSKSNIKDLSDQRLQIQERSKRLEHEIEELQHRNKVKSVTVANLKQGMDKLSHSVAYKSGEIDFLRKEKSRIDNALLKYEQEEFLTRTKDESLIAWKHECNSEASSLISSLHRHTRKFEQGGTEIYNEVNNKYQMKEELERVSYKVDVLQAEVKSLKKTKAVREEELSIESEHEKELRQKLEAALYKLERMGSQLRKCTGKIKVMKNELLVKEAEIKRLQKQVDQHQERLGNLEKLYVGRVDKVSDLECKISKANNDKRKLKSMITDMEQKHMKVRSQLTTAQEQLQRHKYCKEGEAKESELKRVNRMCNALQADMVKVRDEREEDLQMIQRLNELVEEKEMALKALQNKITDNDPLLMEKIEHHKQLKRLKCENKGSIQEMKTLTSAQEKDVSLRNIQSGLDNSEQLKKEQEDRLEELSSLKDCHASCESVIRNLKDEKHAAVINSETNKKEREERLEGVKNASKSDKGEDVNILKIEELGKENENERDQLVRDITNYKELLTVSEKEKTEILRIKSELEKRESMLLKEAHTRESTISNLEKKIQHIRQDDCCIESRNSELENCKKQLLSYEIQNKALTDEIQELTKQKGIDTDNIHNLSTKFQELERKLKELQDQKQIEREVSKENASNLEKSEVVKNELQGKYDALQKELSSLKDCHASCESVIRNLNDEKHAAVINSETNKKELELTKAEVGKIKKHLEITKKSGDEDYAENRVLKQQVEDLKKKLALKEKTDEQQEQKEKVIELSKKVYELQEEQNNAEVERSSLMERIQSGEKDADHYQTTVSELEKKLADEIKQKGEMKAEFEPVKVENKKLKQELKLMCEEASKEKERALKLDVQQREVENLTNENKLKKQKVEQQTKEIQDLKNEIVKLKKAGEEEEKLKRDIEILSKKLKTKDQLVSKTEAELEKSEEIIRKLSVDIANLSQELDEAQMALACLHNDRNGENMKLANIPFEFDENNENIFCQRNSEHTVDSSDDSSSAELRSLTGFENFNETYKALEEAMRKGELFEVSSNESLGNNDESLKGEESISNKDIVNMKEMKQNIPNKLSSPSPLKPFGKLPPLGSKCSLAKLPKLPPLRGKPHHDVASESDINEAKKISVNKNETCVNKKQKHKTSKNKNRPLVKSKRSSLEPLSPLTKQNSYPCAANYESYDDQYTDREEDVGALLTGLDYFRKNKHAKSNAKSNKVSLMPSPKPTWDEFLARKTQF